MSEMRRFRKKQVGITAYQIQETQYIETLEGTLKASPGDYIVTGIKGERYPVREDIFMETYEAID